MFRFVVLALTVSYVSATYGAAGLGLGLGLRHTGGIGFGGLGLGLAHGYAGGLGYGGYAKGLVAPLAVGHAGIIPAAIHSSRSYEVLPVPTTYDVAVPQTIEVAPNVQPVNIIFRTQSSPLNVQQIHTPGVPEYQSTRSEDAPSILNHENVRSVIQNYREIIQPLRNIEQRVNPVIENVHTVVAKGEYAAPIAPAALAAPIDAHLGAPLAAKFAAPLAAPLGAHLGSPLAAKFAAPALLSKGYYK